MIIFIFRIQSSQKSNFEANQKKETEFWMKHFELKQNGQEQLKSDSRARLWFNWSVTQVLEVGLSWNRMFDRVGWIGNVEGPTFQARWFQMNSEFITNFEEMVLWVHYVFHLSKTEPIFIF